MSVAEGGGIFVSYRREDNRDFAGRLFDRLADRFGRGQVFMDVDTIELGVDFGEAINHAVAACKVLLAVIGPGWLTAADERGRRRLDNPDDFVRLEIEAALDRDVRVIPILAQGTVMPGRDDPPKSLARLARRNALFIRHESFRSDAERLITTIERVLAVAPDTRADLVRGWQLVDQRTDQAYRWPNGLEHYDRYNVYRSETQREGSVFISLGWTVRPGAWGMDRRYAVSFLSRGAPQTPLAEFLAADDYDETRELIAIIRGRDGGSKMFGPADDLPSVYVGFRIVTYRDRVRAKGSWNKRAVVASETDTDTILNHALIQARRRGDL